MARPAGSTKQATQQKRNKAASMALAGKTQAEIGKAMGIGQTSVSHLLSDAECKAIIESCQRELISSAPEINGLFLKDCRIEGKLGLDARKRFQDITGIAATHAQSVFLQQIFMGQNQVIGVELGTILRDLLGSKHALPALPSPVIDADIVNTSESSKQ